MSNPFLPKHARDRNINQSFLFLLFSRQKLLNTCKVIQTHKFRLVWHRDFHLLKVFKAIQHFTSFLSQRQRVERDKCQHMSHQFYMLSENPLPPKYFMRLDFSICRRKVLKMAKKKYRSKDVLLDSALAFQFAFLSWPHFLKEPQPDPRSN